MKPKIKSKSPKTDFHNEDIIQRKTRSKRLQNGWKKAQSGNTSRQDIIDIIDESRKSEPEDWGPLVELADEGIDQSDDDRLSATSSVRSGPSFPCKLSAKNPLSLCPECRKLYLKAKRMKAPLKNKLLDINPKSLTCDQWILLKPWSSKTVPDRRGNLLSLSELIHKLSVLRKGRGKTDPVTKELCTRPHLFLQRNLRHCITKPLKEKRKNWRKRARQDSQGPRVAKQQRLLNNNDNHNQTISNNTNSIQPLGNCYTDNCPDPMSSCSTSSLENSDLTLRLRPVSVLLERHSLNLCPKQSVLKKGAGFKDLLAQLRGNNSMIIRESTTEVIPTKHLSLTEWKRS